MNSYESVNLRCVLEDILFECFLDQGFFSPTVMQYETHLHAQYEIHIVEKGEYVLEELRSDKKNIIKENMVAIIPPQCYHNTFFSDEISSVQPDILRYVLRMDFEKIKNDENGMEIYEKFKEAMTHTDSNILVLNSPSIVEAARSLHSEFQKTQNLGRIRANAWLKLCMSNIIHDTIKANNIWDESHYVNNFKEKSRKNEIEKFISENYDNPKLNSEMLEKHLNLSKRQIVRIMTEYYGVPFSKFLINFRLARAEKLLLRTNMTLEKISERVGYESTTGFFLAFKKKYGISPSEFRKRNLDDI